MITAQNLTKRFGSRTVVSDISFTVRPGRVTGFLGPNGAGKSTTMRMIVGLDRPSAGTVTVDGRRYDRLRAPLREVGTLLDARAVHTGRSARDHLRAMAATHGLLRGRVDEVIELTGLSSVAHRRAGTFSLGMGQRLGIASALLGDPRTLLLDEPVNGLDPEGMRWVRALMRHLAAEGRTVLVSSHLMSEMAQTADHVIVLGRGEILADAPVHELVRTWTGARVLVRTPRLADLGEAVSRRGGRLASSAPDTAEVSGMDAATIGLLAAQLGIPLFELTPSSGSLEDAYLALTAGAVDFPTKEYA
ncbi:MAG: ABC transporter ATP-binding protein [Microbacterium enclense]